MEPLTNYKERKNFLIIGLTGPIGSGCTTAAKFLGNIGKITESIEKIVSEKRRKTINNQADKFIKELYGNKKNTNTEYKLDDQSFKELKELLRERAFITELHFQYKQCCHDRFALKYLSFSKTILRPLKIRGLGKIFFRYP